MNFKYRLIRFMSGRYGLDKLFYYIWALAVITAVVNLIVRSWILQLIVYGLGFYAIFRFFSRNIDARRRENTWVLSKLGFIKRRSEFNRRKKADVLHVYKKCPYCKAILRLPHRIGVHKTVCPRCSKEFTVRVKK